ncbi:aspartate/glutamate racemase family protein [Niabella drilacis]|uniref:Aspartate/glutamate racemase n=1 Tax=Niabella drilacis (strain DSM 25811 / CCM 8410 / CCUG 62505 / LMG 26954 / E90) TaxID=1285928 RepID=A0A1G7BXG5_NIADE|nr:aspartate/glutamate racemase family protein [Niabella drilacis]SDE31260.1 Aspartate/glutamate racemase [Niabella drilacis]
MDIFLEEYNGFEFYSITPTSQWWSVIIEFGHKCDHEFVPALSSRMPIEDYFGRFRTRKGFTVLASKEGGFVGCLCNFFEHPETYKPWYQCIIINEKYRQNKLAKKFYELSDNLLKARGELFVHGRTWVENTRNRKALKSIGFYQVATLINDRGDNIHTLFYEKCLFNSAMFKGIKRLGILGGMGSNASAKFLSAICLLTSQTANEQDQLPILLNSATYIPDRTEFLLSNRRQELTKILESEISSFLRSGVSHIVICCFSFHLVLDDILASLKEPVISLVDYINRLLDLKKGTYLLLATNATYKLNALPETDTLFHPKAEDQEQIHNCIYRIKRGESKELVLLDIKKIISNYNYNGVVLGCTDLFLVADVMESQFRDLDIINPLKVMTYDITDSWKLNF